MGIAIEVAAEAPPVVLGVGARLKRAAAHPRLARRMSRMKGVVSLRSSVDRQSVTIRFEGTRIRLDPGVASDADLLITMNFGDDSAKPEVKGAARHPLLGLAVAKVLDPPIGPWPDEAAAFWNFASRAPRMPRSVLVVCTDDGSRLHLGDPGEPEYQVHGTANALSSLFGGSSIFLEDVSTGKLQVAGTLEHASVLTGRSIAWVMGEGR